MQVSYRLFLSLILCLWQYEGFCSFLTEYLQDHHSVNATCMLKRHTVNCYLSAVDSFPYPNACSCNAVKFLSCPWNAVKNRMSLVVLNAYVDGNIYTVVTHLHVVDILGYIYCIFVHLTSLLEVLGQRSKQHMKFWFYSLSISYRLNWFIYNCHNWWYICSFLHEYCIIVFQGQSLKSKVKHRCSC